MKILVTFEIQTPYIEWYAAYKSYAPARAAAGIRDIYCGHDLDNTASIYCLFQADNLKTFENFFSDPDHIEAVKEAGHLLETTKAVALT